MKSKLWSILLSVFGSGRLDYMSIIQTLNSGHSIYSSQPKKFWGSRLVNLHPNIFGDTGLFGDSYSRVARYDREPETNQGLSNKK